MNIWHDTHASVCRGRWPAGRRRGTGCRWCPGIPCSVNRPRSQCRKLPWRPRPRPQHWTASGSQRPGPRTTSDYASLLNSCRQKRAVEEEKAESKSLKSVLPWLEIQDLNKKTHSITNWKVRVYCNGYQHIYIFQNNQLWYVCLCETEHTHTPKPHASWEMSAKPRLHPQKAKKHDFFFPNELNTPRAIRVIPAFTRSNK